MSQADDEGAADETSRLAARHATLARYYDVDVLDVSDDTELYLELARSADGPVLELGVGTGRLAIPLAMAGHDVLGVDDDPEMLARAKQRWRQARGPIDARRLELVQADLRDFRSLRRFALSFIAVNTFLLAADDEERLATLATMRQHLRPGGVACVDIVTPDAQELAGYDGRLQLEWLREEPETGEQVTKTMSARHDPETHSVVLTQIFEATPALGGPLSRVVKVDTVHLVEPTHLAALAEVAGFGEVELWGDHLSIPHGAGSHRAILVARLV